MNACFWTKQAVLWKQESTWATASSRSCRSGCSSPGKSSPCTEWEETPPPSDWGSRDTTCREPGRMEVMQFAAMQQCMPSFKLLPAAEQTGQFWVRWRWTETENCLHHNPMDQSDLLVGDISQTSPEKRERCRGKRSFVLCYFNVLLYLLKTPII